MPSMHRMPPEVAWGGAYRRVGLALLQGNRLEVFALTESLTNLLRMCHSTWGHVLMNIPAHFQSCMHDLNVLVTSYEAATSACLQYGVNKDPMPLDVQLLHHLAQALVTSTE